MPLVRKARRPSQASELRNAQALVESHERKFIVAFTGLLESLLTPEALSAIERAAGKHKNADRILAAVPFFDPDDPRTFPTWEKFARQTEWTYRAVINDTIQNESKKRGWKLRTLKADGDVKLPEEVFDLAIEFIRVRSLTRVIDMSNKEKSRIRSILARGLEDGLRPSEMADKIRDLVGLTEFQSDRLDAKIESARIEGMSASQAKKLRRSEAAKIRLQRARAIARTEANDAMSRGLTESWRQATLAVM